MKSPSFFSRRILLFIIILALSGQACTVSLIKWPTFPTVSPPDQNIPTTEATSLPRAQVTFNVRLLEPLAANEVLAISVLDEVTGLALNAVDYQMTPVDTLTYTATLAIPDQAVIKYRYVRRGASRFDEDTNSDAYIRYRLLLVSGPMQVVDTVNSWADKPVNTLSGIIFGTVLNSDSGAPIPDIMVTAGGV